MLQKSKHGHQVPGETKCYHSTRRHTASRKKGAEGIEKAKEIKELVAPTLKFPYTATYSPELEISESEGMIDISAKTTTLTVSADHSRSNHQGWTQHLSATMEYHWDQQPINQKELCSLPIYDPLASWEVQAPVEEPFKHIGEVRSTLPRQ
ncbi:hypothetical protein VTL71DRAFT_5614 [Oculimacula yallundae]|uniref:Uncharacterized protein n=1 Tax=Oculimacula yallundae TaxID=86028 RepID=A0ABR4C1P2_9HELO